MNDMQTNAGPATVAPAVAWISNSMTPYRLHFFERILREMPWVSLHAGFTHGVGSANWAQVYPPHINPAIFHNGEPPIQHRPAEFLRDWRKGKAMIDWLRQIRVNAAIIAGSKDPGLLRTMRWCVRHDVPFFLIADSNVHGDKTGGHKARLKQWFLRRIVQAARGILVCGSAGKEYYRRYGATEGQLFVVPYEPDYELFQKPDQEILREVRAKFGLQPGVRRIVYSGRLVPVKRIDLLIDAFAAIAESRPEWELLIVGDGPLRGELQSRVPHTLNARVRWLGFCADSAQIGAIYRYCDVLALPSQDEPWGIVVAEALAAGLAVVASDVVGAAVDLVKSNVNGARFKEGDLAALTAALSCITDPAAIDDFKQASAPVFLEWRRTSDPIDGLKKALAITGIAPENRQYADRATNSLV
jgi:glycosyltransferase involved in cell wall biosynthesis